MKAKGFPIITRHAPKPDAAASLDFDALIVLIEPVMEAAASPLPADHPLAVRFRASRLKFVDARSWTGAFQVGGIDLAVA
jgi:hypothetical protein